MDIIWPNNLMAIPIQTPYNVFGGNISIYGDIGGGSGTPPTPPVGLTTPPSYIEDSVTSGISWVNITNVPVETPSGINEDDS